MMMGKFFHILLHFRVISVLAKYFCHFKLINIAEEEIEDDKETWVEHVRDGGDGGAGGEGGDGEDGKHGGAGGDQARDGGDGRQLEFHILHNRVPIRYGNNFVKSVFTNYC